MPPPRTAASVPRVDLLHMPGLGKILRARWSRLLFQIPLLLLAFLVLYDGFTGPELAAENIATVSIWIHYRGLVMLAFLVAGNLFCMSCPFTIPRTLARRLSGQGRRWPHALRNKWSAILLLFLVFFLYEWWDLWASPWLTAWMVIAYVLAAFALEAMFAESPFCKYLCPLGSFNYMASAVSPLQIQARDASVCQTCVSKECVRGSVTVLGCGTELYVPQIESNLDCTFCLDCARACPFDNVALMPRPFLNEIVQGGWPRRWDIALLSLVFVFASLSNAFGMVPPVYDLMDWMARWLPMASEGLTLFIILAGTILALPALLGIGAATLSKALSSSRENTRQILARYAPALVPLGFAIWLGHYGFHFATGALTLVPVFQNFLMDHGWRTGQIPDWTLGPILPGGILLPLQMLSVIIGLICTLWALSRRAADAEGDHPHYQLRVMLPWLLLAIMIAIAGVTLFTLPMEMRGTIDFSH